TISSYNPSSCSAYTSLHHPPLPSFPTRRSSDLTDANVSAMRRRYVAAAFGHLISMYRQANSYQLSSAVWRAKPPSSAGTNSPVGDRKSTRLNSSHVSISYAVFCLKKKKINRHLS